LKATYEVRQLGEEAPKTETKARQKDRWFTQKRRRKGHLKELEGGKLSERKKIRVRLKTVKGKNSGITLERTGGRSRGGGSPKGKLIWIAKRIIKVDKRGGSAKVLDKPEKKKA